MADDRLVDWEALSQEDQLRLRVAYGRYLDDLPPTCALDEKRARFSYWLQQQGFQYVPVT